MLIKQFAETIRRTEVTKNVLARKFLSSKTIGKGSFCPVKVIFKAKCSILSFDDNI